MVQMWWEKSQPFPLGSLGQGTCVTWTCVLAAGSIRIESAELPSVLGFVFARSGIQLLRQSVTSETEGVRGHGLTVFTRGVQTLLAQNSAVDSGMLACLCVWVLGLWPWAMMSA